MVPYPPLPSFLIGVTLLLAGCSSRPATQVATPSGTSPSAATAAARDTHENLNGYLWVRTSAEYQALASAIYRGARTSLERALADPAWTALPDQPAGSAPRPAAVIMDIDETVLDNSPAQGQFILDRTPYVADTWRAWVETASAPALPGALDFITFAESRGVTIFYVTNRNAGEQQRTIDNLVAVGVEASDDNVLVVGEQGWTSDKTARRAHVAATHRVLLLVGDDMNDFISTASLTPAQRVALAHEHADRWGQSWILLPNPQYGTWERALYPGISTDDAVLEKKRETVKGFR